MRFKEFMNLEIGLVGKKTDLDDYVQTIEKDMGLSSELVELKKTLNSELGNVYRGKYLFDFCEKQDINIDDLKIKENKRKKRIKAEWFKVLNELAKTKTNIERKVCTDGSLWC